MIWGSFFNRQYIVYRVSKQCPTEVEYLSKEVSIPQN